MTDPVAKDTDDRSPENKVKTPVSKITSRL